MDNDASSAATRKQMQQTLAQIMASPGPLDDKLAVVRARRDDFLPAEITAVMDRAIEDLVSSGIRASALKPGNALPAFTLPDTAGQPHDIGALLRQGPVVISFYRGGWCAYCNLELRALNEALPEIQALGASLVAVSPELPERQAATQEAHGLGFPILHDAGNRVARMFGIVYQLPADLLGAYQALGHDPAEMNGSAGATELALPATFVAGADGIIRLAHVDEDYARRLTPEAVLAILRK